MYTTTDLSDFLCCYSVFRRDSYKISRIVFSESFHTTVKCVNKLCISPLKISIQRQSLASSSRGHPS